MIVIVKTPGSHMGSPAAAEGGGEDVGEIPKCSFLLHKMWVVVGAVCVRQCGLVLSASFCASSALFPCFEPTATRAQF